MIEFREHIETITNAVRKAEGDENGIPNLVFLCKDGKKVECDMSYTLLFSPFIRSILDSINFGNLGTLSISLPDFHAATVESLNKITALAWDESDVWSSDDLELFTTFNIDVGVPEIVSDTEDKLDTGVDISNTTEEREIVLDSESNGDDEASGDEEESDGLKYSCPKCPKQFTGTLPSIKDSMRCHVGLDHLDTELEAFVGKTFSEDTCSICQKVFKSLQRQKKHLLLTHKALAVKLSAILDTAFKNSKTETLKGPEEKSLLLVKLATHEDQNSLKENNKRTDDILDESRKKFEAKFPTLTLDISRKVIPVTGDKSDEMSGDKIPSDETGFQCTECDQVWPYNVKGLNTVCKSHLMVKHFAEGFECQIRNYFRKTYCTLCRKKVSGGKKIHLYSVHSILKKEVDTMYLGIKSGGKATLNKVGRPKKSIGSNKRKNDDNETSLEDSNLTVQSLEGRKKPNKRRKKMSRNIAKKEEKKVDFDELDILLKDSDEESESVDDNSSIQEVIMEDISGGHQSEEDLIVEDISDDQKSDEEIVNEKDESDDDDCEITKEEISVNLGKDEDCVKYEVDEDQKNIANDPEFSDDENSTAVVEGEISDEEEDDPVEENDDNAEIQRNLLLDQDMSDDEETSIDDVHDNTLILGVKESLRKELGLSDEEEDMLDGLLEDYSPSLSVGGGEISD